MRSWCVLEKSRKRLIAQDGRSQPSNNHQAMIRKLVAKWHKKFCSIQLQWPLLWNKQGGSIAMMVTKKIDFGCNNDCNFSHNNDCGHTDWLQQCARMSKLSNSQWRIVHNCTILSINWSDSVKWYLLVRTVAMMWARKLAWLKQSMNDVGGNDVGKSKQSKQQMAMRITRRENKAILNCWWDCYHVFHGG